MALGPNTSVVNGQRVPFFNDDGFWPKSWVPVAPVGVAMTYPVGAPAVDGMGVNARISHAMNSPWSLTHSPLPWAIAFLVVGLIGLRVVHWRFLGKEL